MRRESRRRPLCIDVAQPSSECQGTARRPLLRHRRYGSGPPTWARSNSRVAVREKGGKDIEDFPHNFPLHQSAHTFPLRLRRENQEPKGTVRRRGVRVVDDGRSCEHRCLRDKHVSRYRFSGSPLSALPASTGFRKLANDAPRRASNWMRAERFGIRASRSGTHASRPTL